MASSKQVSANQLNAMKSTGPVTDEGKSKVAINAVKYGIFSKNLFLSDEDPTEFRHLLQQLTQELTPAGALELTLVERIAIAIWRQKRLIRAESATIELGRKPQSIASAVNSELNMSFSDQAISKDDLSEFDVEQFQWSQSILSEYSNLDFDNLLDMDQLKIRAPLIYQQLLTDAEDDCEEPDEYLKNYKAPIQYFIELTDYCRQQIKQAEQRPIILAIAAMVKSKRVILSDKARDALAKYQVMLDNELYKAMKALRDAQDWRMKNLPLIPEQNGFVLEKAG